MHDPITAGREAKHLGGELTLTDRDMADLNEGVHRVFALMKDGNWHSPDEIRIAAGTSGKPASEGLRRLRELRRFFEIEKKRVGEARLWLYRLGPRLS